MVINPRRWWWCCCRGPSGREKGKRAAARNFPPQFTACCSCFLRVSVGLLAVPNFIIISPPIFLFCINFSIFLSCRSSFPSVFFLLSDSLIPPSCIPPFFTLTTFSPFNSSPRPPPPPPRLSLYLYLPSDAFTFQGLSNGRSFPSSTVPTPPSPCLISSVETPRHPLVNWEQTGGRGKRQSDHRTEENALIRCVMQWVMNKQTRHSVPHDRHGTSTTHHARITDIHSNVYCFFNGAQSKILNQMSVFRNFL